MRQEPKIRRYCVDDLETPPESLVSELTQTSKTWIRVHGTLLNSSFFDSRTDEWTYVVSKLCSSALASTTVLIDLMIECSPHPKDLPPRFYRSKHGKNAFNAIKRSPLCVKIEDDKYEGLMAVRMTPLYKAVPFVIGLFQNPPDDHEEAQYPKGYYVQSMFIRLKGFLVTVHLHRC